MRKFAVEYENDRGVWHAKEKTKSFIRDVKNGKFWSKTVTSLRRLKMLIIFMNKCLFARMESEEIL